MISNPLRRLTLIASLLAACLLGAAANASVDDTPHFSSYTVLGISSMTVTWTGTGSYQAIISTGAFPVNSDNGFAGNQYSTPPLFSPDPISWTFSGLSANTTYYVDISTLTAGVPTYTSFTATSTLADAPASLGPLTASANQILAAWDPGQNPALTLYDCQISLNSGFSPLWDESFTADPETIFAGLTPNTSYYLRVQAINNNGVSSAGGFIPLRVTTTTPSSLGEGFTSVGATLATVKWAYSSGGPPPIFNAVAATTYPPESSFTISSATLNLYATLTGMIPNTHYYAAVQAIGSGGSSAFFELGSTVTLANPPISSGMIALPGPAISGSWLLNDNPVGTSYNVRISTYADFRSTGSLPGVLGPPAQFDGLLPLTRYYMQVQAVNSIGKVTEFVSLGSMITLPAPPAVPVLSSSTLGTSSVTWTWSLVPLATGYRILNAGVNISGDLGAGISSWLETDLSTNTSNTRSLAAFNSVGASTSVPVTVVTYAVAPTASSVTVVGFSSATFSWSAADDPSPATRYVAEYWQLTGATTTVTTASTSVHLDVLPGATYYLDVYALNLAGVATSRTVAISTFLPLINLDRELINPDTGGTLTAYTAHGPITVYFPPATFTVPVWATLNGLGALPHALSNAAQMTATGVGAEIDVVPALQPNRPVSITIAYLPADMAGFNAAQLAMAYYDPAENLWVPITSFSNSSLKQVNGQSHHLSSFEIKAVTPAADLSLARVFPNPFRPALGHSIITFSQLPANTRVRIYTVSGELVKDMTADSTGIARWGATNQSGRNAASGGYFALVQGAGDKSILKVLIQR